MNVFGNTNCVKSVKAYNARLVNRFPIVEKLREKWIRLDVKIKDNLM